MIGAEQAARARPVFNDNLLPKRLRQGLCDAACDDVYIASGGNGHDESNWAIRVVSGLLRNTAERDEAKRKASEESFHESSFNKRSKVV